MLDTIKINGHDYPIVFNWRTVKIYEKETEESYYAALDGLLGTSPKATTLIGLIYAAIMAAAVRNIDLETIFKHTLKFTNADITKITTLYLDSLPKSDATETPSDQANTHAPGEQTGQPSKGALA
jgi:hypothetical protein